MANIWLDKHAQTGAEPLTTKESIALIQNVTRNLTNSHFVTYCRGAHWYICTEPIQGSKHCSNPSKCSEFVDRALIVLMNPVLEYVHMLMSLLVKASLHKYAYSDFIVNDLKLLQ